MGGQDRYVLDTNVLSSFRFAGWFDAFDIWLPENELAAPEAVWEEFYDRWDQGRPEWITVESVDLEDVETDVPGAIDPNDWRCVVLVERSEDAQLVSNDKGIHSVADHRDTSVEWGTRFLLRTFQRCGMSKSRLDEGASDYINDLHLPDEVADEIRDAEKETDETE